MLNTSVPIPWQDHYVCQERPIYVEHHGHVHPNFVPPSANQRFWSIRVGAKVALKAGRKRVVGQDMVTKTQGPVRPVLSLDDYRYMGQFDPSANYIVVGEKAPCAAPSHRTTTFVKIPERYSLDEIQLINR